MINSLLSLIKKLLSIASSPKFDANEFRPSKLEKEALDDPRTLAVPLAGSTSALTYFDVTSMLVKERLSLKRALRAGWNFKVAEELAAGPEKSAFGQWVACVQAEGRQNKIRQNLQLWHQAWHMAAKEILVLVAKGDLTAAEHKFTYGECGLASKRMAMLLEQFWEYEGENASRALVPAYQNAP